MLARDITVVDLGGENWSRLLEILSGMGTAMAPERKKRGLLIVYRGLSCLKAIELREQREVEVDFQGTWRLEALAKRYGYDFVVALEQDALERIFSEAGRTIDYRDDYFKAWGDFARAATKEWRRTIFTWPAGPRRLPVPSHRLLELLLKLYVPDDTIILLAFTEQWRARASVALGYRDGDVRLLTSLDALGDEEADLSGHGLKEAAVALGRRFGGNPRAISIELSALDTILNSRFPLGAALYAVNASEVKTYRVPLRWKFATLLEVLALPFLRK